MPRDSNAVYSLPNGYLAVTGETVLASQHNGPLEDIAQSLTASLPRTGTGAMQANLPMGGFRITNLANGSAGTDATSLTQVQALISAAAAALIPPGTIVDFAGTLAPDGWLLCHGQAVSRTTYAGLFGILSTNYGAGDGTTTFNLPDIRGRVRAGKDNMGDSTAGRLTGLSGGVNGIILGGTGGAEAHTLTSGQHAAHTHTVPATVTVPRDGWGTSGFSLGTVSSGRIVVGSGNAEATEVLESLRSSGNDQSLSLSGSQASGSSGSGEAHNNVQPTIIFNVIIKT